MKTTRITENAWQLTFLSFSNCFLLREEDGFTLIDTSIGGRQRKIVEAARSLGASIRRVLLTHAHGDHIGSLDGVHRLLGEVDVAISEREAPLLHKDKSLRPGEPRKKLRGSLPGARTRPTHTLQDGELYGSLRCIATPGHTPGHMSFLDERDGTLFAGDAMVSIGRLAVVSKPVWWFPLPRLATWDKGLALQSARRLAGLRPAAIATGHGRFVPEAGAAVQRAQADAERG